LRTHYGSMLLGLAWPFHLRGDDEQARHLLAEGWQRTLPQLLEQFAPRLHAWAEERRVAWGIEGTEATEGS